MKKLTPLILYFTFQASLISCASAAEPAEEPRCSYQENIQGATAALITKATPQSERLRLLYYPSIAFFAAHLAGIEKRHSFYAQPNDSFADFVDLGSAHEDTFSMFISGRYMSPAGLQATHDQAIAAATKIKPSVTFATGKSASLDRDEDHVKVVHTSTGKENIVSIESLYDDRSNANMFMHSVSSRRKGIHCFVGAHPIFDAEKSTPPAEPLYPGCDILLRARKPTSSDGSQQQIALWAIKPQ